MENDRTCTIKLPLNYLSEFFYFKKFIQKIFLKLEKLVQLMFVFGQLTKVFVYLFYQIYKFLKIVVTR